MDEWKRLTTAHDTKVDAGIMCREIYKLNNHFYGITPQSIVVDVRIVEDKGSFFVEVKRN
jgi:hypothetical protein